MFYYLYEIKNNVNGKIYVGVHKTKVLDDGYMGSGKVIRRSIEKNGIENFTKTILEHFSSSEEMYAREKEVVNEEFLDRDDTYNLRRGGSGGFDYIVKNGLNWSDERREKGMSEETRTKISNTLQLGYSSGRLDYVRELNSKRMESASHPMKDPINADKVRMKLSGVSKSAEHRLRISEAHKKLDITPSTLGRKFPNKKKRDKIEYKSVVCPHCEKEGKSNVMGRWHFENCRFKD